MKRCLWVLILGAVFTGVAFTAAAAQADMADAELSEGEALYSSCLQCHQASGEGRAYAYPPLAEHVPDILEAEGGRAYLISVLLYGVQGEIVVDGSSYNGAMPGWSQFSDAELASLLNYISSEWENLSRLPKGTAAFSAEEVAAERSPERSTAEVYELRQALALEDSE